MRGRCAPRRLGARFQSRARRAWPLIALAWVSILVAACGGGSGSSVASITAHSTSPSASTHNPSASAPYANALDYARCMRRHGEPDFPDPSNPGGFSTGALARLDTESRRFVAADSTCLRLLPNGGQPTPAEFQQAVTDGLRFARCMRAHGVAFPDPGISGSQMTIDLGEVDTSSPAYTRASQSCRTGPVG